MRNYNPTVLALILVFFASNCMAEEDEYTYAQIWNTKYKIPAAYDASSSGSSIGFNATLDTFKPYRTGRGWNNRILVLVTKSYARKGSHIWESHHAESLRNNYKRHQFVETKRIKNTMTKYVTGAGEDIYVPDQDMEVMPIGFIECTRATEIFIDPSCRHYFIKQNQAWKITFGSQHLPEYAKIRKRTETFVSRFEVK